MTLSKKMQDALNAQISMEMWSSNLYLNMAFWFRKEGWAGFAQWMVKQSEEERDHAMAFADYILRRDGEAKVAGVDAVPSQWDDVKAVFENSLKHEQSVSESINALAEIAENEKDRASQNFLAKFIDEQVEEEETLRGILDVINHKEGCDIAHLDIHMGQRK